MKQIKDIFSTQQQISSKLVCHLWKNNNLRVRGIPYSFCSYNKEDFKKCGKQQTKQTKK